MCHHRSDIIHAFLPPEDRILIGYLNWHAVTIEEPLRNLCFSAAITALESKVSRPCLSFQSLCNIKHDLRAEKQYEVIVQVFILIEGNRNG